MTMPTEQRAAVQIRHARWLLEQAAAAIVDTPYAGARLDYARQLLGQIGGDYREGEELLFEASDPQPMTDAMRAILKADEDT